MNDTPYRYDPALAEQIELSWQDRWAEEGTFRAPNPSGPWADPKGVAGREKLLVLDMFPYPSGAGLHVGHPLGYIATDVWARFHRMTGKNVLHCLGYDAFGLPAEQYAVQTGQHPRTTTEANMVTMKRQLRRLGLGHDDRRAIATIDPEYYRWTQWIFLQIYNAWYDADAVRADGGRGKARPIDELIAELDSGERQLDGEFAGRAWSDLAAAERHTYLDTRRLAYTSEAPVNWCPGLGTVLSNEEVTNEGRSERGNYPVFRANLRQWMMRITAYADRLADDLDRVDWPDKVKHMQRNWIGRSQGAKVDFAVAERGATAGPDAQPRAGVDPITVFTTRPDTLFGATFMVLAPEHPLVDELVADAWPTDVPAAWRGTDIDGSPVQADSPREAVEAYRRAAARKSDVERQVEDKTKTGVFTGGFGINPVTGEAIPVFVADYVLMGYGTGAIMAVPAHDERDYAFASAFGVPIRDVVAPADADLASFSPSTSADAGEAFTAGGVAVNSADDEVSLDGLGLDEAKARMIAWLDEKGVGEGTVNYRLRDWLFSRQRYWGEPFPIVFDEDGLAHALPDSALPVALPDVPDYSPKTFDPDDADSRPEPPLSRVPEWVEVELDLGDGVKKYRRETNTMPNWAGSCWYYLRYLDPANHDALVDPVVEEYWMGPRESTVAGAPAGAKDPGGVDLYVGGVEHAVLHLLYARFWHKVLFDLGHVSSEEPFRRYFSQGYIQAYAYRDHRGQPVPAAEVEETVGENGTPTFTWQGEPVTREYGKIGKSLKNVVSPDEMYEQYGADTFRVHEMSMGPLELSKPWETRAVVGSQRFLQRLWRNVVDESTGESTVTEDTLDDETQRLLHRTIDGVRADYAGLRFNTAISKLIELNNHLTKLGGTPRAAAEPLVLMVAPVAPHLAEELWRKLGHAETLTYEPFPEADPALLVEDTVTCVVQIKGKVRARIEVPADINDADLEAVALAEPRVADLLAGQTVRKVIVRAPGLVNVVTG
ncbi:leucine--tRNA ligase [Mobilicoccus pelagius]|uniref:Leucine--tRNA ligase n=1 Tax=Mobilicoccus pelagius NBRC 104925 TaxID=1089455 RepID=H5UNU8_9MICO|nr:class I tRNA ligase family protein [Mobilicoccus pelagius]GAB47406.1 leucyl-tRNA synthetase [Mobilicoccus pelagius NBRC 104925]